MTDTSGDVVWEGRYSPFGEVEETTALVQQDLRFPGQLLDREAGLHYNYFRDYDPQMGRYTTSDPIGLEGGVNTYAYVMANPMKSYDPDGLEVRFICRDLTGMGSFTGKQHCFVHISCPEEGWQTTVSLFGGSGVWPSEGAIAFSDGRDNPNDPNNTFDEEAFPPDQCPGGCV